MVTGLDKFREAFLKYADNYVIIGGTACDIVLRDTDMKPRATSDIDMIVIVENMTPEFAAAFWKFIRDGKYKPTKRDRETDGQTVYTLYRFEEAQNFGEPLLFLLRSQQVQNGDRKIGAIDASAYGRRPASRLRHLELDRRPSPLVDGILLIEHGPVAIANPYLQRERRMSPDFVVAGQRMRDHINIEHDTLARNGFERKTAMQVQPLRRCLQIAPHLSHPALGRGKADPVTRGIERPTHQRGIVTPPLVEATPDFDRKFFNGFHHRTNITFLSLCPTHPGNNLSRIHRRQTALGIIPAHVPAGRVAKTGETFGTFPFFS